MVFLFFDEKIIGLVAASIIGVIIGLIESQVYIYKMRPRIREYLNSNEKTN